MSIRFLILFLFFISPLAAALGQGVVTNFGSARQKTHRPHWFIYPFETLDVISESDVPQLAIAANALARDFLLKAEKQIDFRYNGRLQLIIFKNELSYRESNFGLEASVFNTGGYTYQVSNEVVTVFNGNMQDFFSQIRTGIVDVLLGEMIYGGSLQDRAQATTLLFVPNWYFKGAVEFLANGWTAEHDAEFRKKFQNDHFRNLNNVNDADATLWGQSFWNFINQVYGKESVPEILYLTRSSKGHENAFRYVLNTGGWMLFEDWRAYYQKVYKIDDASFEGVKRPMKLEGPLANAEILQAVANNKGNRVYLITREKNFWKLYSASRTGKAQEIRRWPVPVTPEMRGIFTPPVFAIDEFDKQIAISYRSKDGLMLDIGSLSTFKFKTFPVSRLEMIQSLALSAYTDKIFATGIRNGQSNLYEYDIKAKKLNQLSHDDYDYLDVSILSDTNGIQLLFASNLPASGKEIPQDRSTFLRNRIFRGLDIFIWKSDSTVEAVTNTPGRNERRPLPYPGGYIGFLSDYSGLSNVHVAKKTEGVVKSYIYLTMSKDSLSEEIKDTLVFDFELPDDSVRLKEILTPYIPRFMKLTAMRHENIRGEYFKVIANTHYNRGVLNHTVNAVTYRQLLVMNADKKNAVLIRDLPEDLSEMEGELNRSFTYFREKQMAGGKIADSAWRLSNFLEKNKGKGSVPATPLVDTSARAPKYFFQTDFPDIDSNLSRRKSIELIKQKDNDLPEAKEYRSNLQPRYLVLQLDNSIMSTYYHPVGSPGFMFSTPPIMLMTKAVFSDNLNDIDFELGMRMPFSFTGNDFFVHYENRKRRLPFSMDYWRQSRRFEEGGNYLRQAMNEARFGLRLPLSETWSVKMEPFYRWENNTLLGIDSVAQITPNNDRRFLGLKAELVKDNTKTLGINMLEGFRGKAYFETFQGVGEIGSSASVNVAGWDLRFYKRMARKMVWATRFTGATTFGPSKILYYIGGTENWVGVSQNIETATDAAIPYTFQSIQNGMRGFIRNIRNGSSFMLMNTELRIPIFDYLSKYPQRSDFVRSMLLVPFVDFGTAWNGPSPFQAQAYNTRNLTSGAADIKVRSISSPFVGAFGFGIRSRLLRYYFRTDFSWGISDGTVQKQVFFFSLGQDF